jgi:trehalose 6-phosphate phosphatase
MIDKSVEFGDVNLTAERSSAKDGFPAIDPVRDALLLDIDGTIIDIAPTPEAVNVPESLKLNLSRVRDALNGALALVSGRTLASVDRLFAPLGFAAVGCHGAEVRLSPHGNIHRRARSLGANVEADFVDIGKLDPRIRLEDKHYTFAIHYRRAPELENEVFGMVNAKLNALDRELEVMCGKAVIEIKSSGFNKGTGLHDLMQYEPFAGRRPVFFGDDTTDEDAFARLPEFGGVGISVGRSLPGASSFVRSPLDVRHWLAELAGKDARA